MKPWIKRLIRRRVLLASTQCEVEKPPLKPSTAEWGRWMAGDTAVRPTARCQLLDWIIRRRADSFELMSNLPKSLASGWMPSGRSMVLALFITTARQMTPTSWSWSVVTAAASSVF